MAERDKRKKNRNRKPEKDPYAQLTRKQLKRTANQLTRTQIRPQVRAAGRQAKLLQTIFQNQVGTQKRLSNQAQGNVSSYYKSLADAEAKNLAYQKALSGRLSAGTAAAGTSALDVIGTASEGALGALNEQGAKLGNVSGDARAQLAALVANQQGHAAREGQALSAQAGSQGAGYEAMQQQMASSAAMQGGTNLTNVVRQGLENVRELQSTFGPEIIAALGNKKDILASRGDIKAQLLRQLVSEEREYGLSRAALKLDKQQAKADSGVSPTVKFQAKQNRKLAKLKADIERERAAGNYAQAERLARVRARLSRKYLNQQQSGNDDGGGGKLSEFDREDIRRAKSKIRTEKKIWKDIKSGDVQIQKAADALSYKYNIDTKLAKILIRDFLKQQNGGLARRTRTELGQSTSQRIRNRL